MVSTDEQLGRFAFEAYQAVKGGGRWPGRRWDQLTDHERVRWAQVGEVMRSTVLAEHDLVTGGAPTCPVDGLYSVTGGPTTPLELRLIGTPGDRCPTCGVSIRPLPDWDAPPGPPASGQVVKWDTAKVDHG